jgi:hypothetical protein
MPRSQLNELRLVEVLGHLPFASNTTVLAEAADGSRWVYKPVRGEQPLWDFAWRSLAAREVLTFETSEAMGLGVVPETVMANGPLGPGSAQKFLDEDSDFDPRPLFSPSGLDERLWPFAVLDLVTNNADRKVGHLLKARDDERLWAIDNGLTFHAQPKLRTVLWGFAGKAIPSPLVEAARRAAVADWLFERITLLLSREEANATRYRLASILDSPIHPEPPDDRPAVPWPIW